MKKAIVTGGVGFIGTNLIEELVKRHYDVTSIDDYSAGSDNNEIEGVRYLNMDINDIKDINDNFDICFHLAAKSRVQPSFLDPKEYLRVNVLGTSSIMEWADNWDIKVIYAGSSSKHHDPTDSPYAMYKYLGEEVCKLYKKSFNVDIQIARFYNVYGPGESLDEKFGNVIGIWRTKCFNSEKLPIVGDGEQRRDFTHVDDIVDGLIRISQTDKIHDDAWELGSGVNYSVNELFGFFEERFKAESEYIPDQKGNYRETLNTNPDAERYLGWEPKDRLKEYIQSL